MIARHTETDERGNAPSFVDRRQQSSKCQMKIHTWYTTRRRILPPLDVESRRNTSKVSLAGRQKAPFSRRGGLFAFTM